MTTEPKGECDCNAFSGHYWNCASGKGVIHPIPAKAGPYRVAHLDVLGPQSELIIGCRSVTEAEWVAAKLNEGIAEAKAIGASEARPRLEAAEKVVERTKRFLSAWQRGDHGDKLGGIKWPKRYDELIDALEAYDAAKKEKV